MEHSKRIQLQQKYRNLENCVFENAKGDFQDVFLVSAELNGKPLTEEEIDELHDESEIVYELAWESVH